MAETLHSNIHLVSERGPRLVETELCGGDDCGRVVVGGFKAEIDTSAPFESVKEAVSRFGGGGFWKPGQNVKLNEAENCDLEHIDIAKVKEQASALQKELILKEKDTLAVLKELEATKFMVEQLKSKLRKEESSVPSTPYADQSFTEEDEKENNPDVGEVINRNLDPAVEQEAKDVKGSDNDDCLGDDSSTPAGLILMELAQAKLNLVRTTDDLSEIRASVESYNKKIEKERASLEKTRERLSSNSSKILALEEELRRTQMKLEMVKDGDGKEFSAEMQRLNAEAEQFKKMGEAARAEVIRAVSEIEQTKASVNTAEVRLIAAEKMKEAARAAEAMALAEIKALEKSGNSSIVLTRDPEAVSLTPEAYTSLMNTAQGAEESTRKRVEEAMVQMDEANLSKSEILKRVEEAMEEVKTSKKALEEALNKVDEANRAKLAVEEALRKWRSENGQRRRSSVQNSTKFKTFGPSSIQRRDSRTLVDVNGVDLAGGGDVVTAAPELKPTLSIGQILSRKLLVTEEFESGRGSGVKRKVSLGQMLGRQNGDIWSSWTVEKENNGGGVGVGSGKKLPVKRKKFGFARLSVLLAKQNKRKKKPTSTAR